MKKIIFLILCIFLITGCSSIKDLELENIINEITSSKVTTTNVYRNGYSYYLPKGISLSNSSSFNEILTDQKYNYYLYVDIVKYNNQVAFTYNINEDAVYSKNIDYNGKKGYIEINIYENDKYLIEIMYNYAKIEVVGYVQDVNEIAAYSMVILSSITYNDNVIENYLASSSLDSVEESFDIFEIVGSNNYIEFAIDETSGETNDDPDYVN